MYSIGTMRNNENRSENIMMCPKCGNEMERAYLFSSKDGAFSGNVIYVDPNEKVVAAVSACFRPAVHDCIDFIENILLPTINKSPLF